MRKQFFVFLYLIISFTVFSQDYWEKKDSVKGPPKAGSASFSLGSAGVIVGGLDEFEFKRKSYVYNPFLDDWDETTSLGGEFGDGLQRASACGFSIEKNGITKGYIALGQTQTIPFMNDLWEFDPTTETWSQKADFIGPSRRQAVSFVINDHAFVGTGEGQSGLLSDFYAYNSSTNSWNQISDFPGTARKQAVAFSLAGNGFVGTGDDGTKRNDFWMYNSEFNTWISKAQFPGIARSGACSWSNFPTAFVGTGEGLDFSFLNDLYEYNYYSNSWTQRASLPGPPRKNAIALNINGVGYIGTGYNNVFLDDFYAYFKISSVSEHNEPQINIYPNPAASNIQLNIKLVENYSIKILDSEGSVVFCSSDLNLSPDKINLEHLPSGQYNLLIESKNVGVIRKSFVKI